MQITINGKREELDRELTVAELIGQLELQPKQVAVEVKFELGASAGSRSTLTFGRRSGRDRDARRGRLKNTLTTEAIPNQTDQDDLLQVGEHTLSSRLIVGTGKYSTFDQMREALDASGTHCITVAVRRERLYDEMGKNILDYIDLSRYLLLPNTAGCYNVEDALRTAPLGPRDLAGVGKPRCKLGEARGAR